MAWVWAGSQAPPGRNLGGGRGKRTKWGRAAEVDAGGGGVGGRKTNSDKPRQEGEELREMAGRPIRTGMTTRMIGRLGEKLREMSCD